MIDSGNEEEYQDVNMLAENISRSMTWEVGSEERERGRSA